MLYSRENEQQIMLITNELEGAPRANPLAMVSRDALLSTSINRNVITP
jgi:hypothetical protein